MGSDPYAVLGIARDATGAQITQARHQLVRKYHPDVNHDPDAAARFGAVQQAFDLLSDPAARAEYDRTHDEQGHVPVMRAADGGYGLGGGEATGIVILPASVDFGVLTPRRQLLARHAAMPRPPRISTLRSRTSTIDWSESTKPAGLSVTAEAASS